MKDYAAIRTDPAVKARRQEALQAMVDREYGQKAPKPGQTPVGQSIDGFARKAMQRDAGILTALVLGGTGVAIGLQQGAPPRSTPSDTGIVNGARTEVVANTGTDPASKAVQRAYDRQDRKKANFSNGGPSFKNGGGAEAVRSPSEQLFGRGPRVLPGARTGQDATMNTGPVSDGRGADALTFRAPAIPSRIEQTQFKPVQ